MEILTFAAMMMTIKAFIQLKDISILGMTMTMDLPTAINMTTTIPIDMRGTIITTAITDTAIPIYPPALTERR
jgi:hypothetical protein